MRTERLGQGVRRGGARPFWASYFFPMHARSCTRGLGRGNGRPSCMRGARERAVRRAHAKKGRDCCSGVDVAHSFLPCPCVTRQLHQSIPHAPGPFAGGRGLAQVDAVVCVGGGGRKREAWYEKTRVQCSVSIGDAGALLFSFLHTHTAAPAGSWKGGRARPWFWERGGGARTWTCREGMSN